MNLFVVFSAFQSDQRSRQVGFKWFGEKLGNGCLWSSCCEECGSCKNYYNTEWRNVLIWIEMSDLQNLFLNWPQVCLDDSFSPVVLRTKFSVQERPDNRNLQPVLHPQTKTSTDIEVFFCSLSQHFLYLEQVSPTCGPRPTTGAQANCHWAA